MDEDQTRPSHVVSQAAAPLLEHPLVEPASMADLERRARRRSSRRQGVAALTLVTLLIGAAGLMARAGTPDASIGTGSGPTSTLPLPHLEGDVLLILEPGTSAADVQLIRDHLVADPAVRRVLYQSEPDRHRDMECMYAASPDLLRTGIGAGFGQTFRVYLDGDRDAMLRFLTDEVSTFPRVKGSEYVRAEDQPTPMSDPSEPGVTVTIDPENGTWVEYPTPPDGVPDLSCPLIGEWVK